MDATPKKTHNLRYTTLEYISKLRKIYGNQYDYSKLEYTGSKKSIIIICRKHGKFKQIAGTHLAGHGCSRCGDHNVSVARKKTTFISEATKLHNGKYDYSLTKYISSKDPVIIICPEPGHGEFEQKPTDHLAGCGCPVCGIIDTAHFHENDINHFISISNAKHGEGTYDYSESEYFGVKCDITIICREHGKFKQSANNHMQGSGCPSCAKTGFDNEKPGILYYLRITDNGNIYYKIGITNIGINKRYSPKEMKHITIVREKEYLVGKDARTEEQRILKEFNEYRLTEPISVIHAGWTEMFTEDVLNWDR